MDTNQILIEALGSSPLLGFLVWFIVSERKQRENDKKERQTQLEELNEQQKEREKSYTQLLIKNHDVIKDNQKVIEALTDKYEDIREQMKEGFFSLNRDIKDVYSKLTKKD